MAPVYGGRAPESPCAPRCVQPRPPAFWWNACPECRETWVLSPPPLPEVHPSPGAPGSSSEARAGQVPPRPGYRWLRAIAGAERPRHTAHHPGSVQPQGPRGSSPAVGRQDRPVTHETLERDAPRARPSPTLRAILVATGILPGRRRAHPPARAVDQRGQPDSEKTPAETARSLHSYRDLAIISASSRTPAAPTPRRPGCRSTTSAQPRHPRPASFSGLARPARGLTPGTHAGRGDPRTGTTARRPPTSPRPSHFIRWAVRKPVRPRDLTAGAIRWSGPQGPHDTEKRWDDARRLLNDGTLAIQDRGRRAPPAATYAQRITAITTLTTDNVPRRRSHRDHHPRHLAGRLGPPAPSTNWSASSPPARPPRGTAAIGPGPAVTPWLFAGGPAREAHHRRRHSAPRP